MEQMEPEAIPTLEADAGNGRTLEGRGVDGGPAQAEVAASDECQWV
jgi:hypothetical protein